MPNPIKKKFIEHMELYQLSKETQKGYISGVPLGLPKSGSHLQDYLWMESFFVDLMALSLYFGQNKGYKISPAMHVLWLKCVDVVYIYSNQ